MSVFDIHRAMHRNIISIVKPTRCTNVSNLLYFGMTLYMLRTIFPPIKRHLSNRYCCLFASGYLLAGRQQYLFDRCLLLYVQSWTPDDGRKDRPKHVECHSKIKQIWYIGASSWFYYRNYVCIFIIIKNTHTYTDKYKYKNTNYFHSYNLTYWHLTALFYIGILHISDDDVHVCLKSLLSFVLDSPDHSLFKSKHVGQCI